MCAYSFDLKPLKKREKKMIITEIGIENDDDTQTIHKSTARKNFPLTLVY